MEKNNKTAEASQSILIQKTIGLGDSGTPFHLEIDVDFYISGGVYIVTDCVERECPYDNPPYKWEERIKAVVDEYFFDLNPAYAVMFKL